MNTQDEVAMANQRLWEEEVRKGCGWTTPWLDLDVSQLRQYADGRQERLPEPMTDIYPASMLKDIEGKDVLCLASGGGQQSAVFSLLGARVTVVDLAEGQLEGDRKAAEHYGYDVTTFHADMRDLSCLKDNTFDFVYQAPSMCYIPDIRQVYAEVERLLKKHGTYRFIIDNPATFAIDWNGKQYYLKAPYSEKVEHREDGGIEFRHYMDDVFNGLIDLGFSILRVFESPYSKHVDPDAPEGSWNHFRSYVAGAFILLVRKGQ